MLRLVPPPAVAHGIALPSADPSEGGDTLGLNAATAPAAYYADAAEMQAAEFPSMAAAYRSGWRWGLICGLLFGCIATACALALGLSVG